MTMGKSKLSMTSGDRCEPKNRTVSVMTRMIPRNESDCMTTMAKEQEGQTCGQTDFPPMPCIPPKPPKPRKTCPALETFQLLSYGLPEPQLPKQPQSKCPFQPQRQTQCPLQSQYQPQYPIQSQHQSQCCALQSQNQSQCPPQPQQQSNCPFQSQQQPQNFPIVHQAFKAQCGICGQTRRHEADVIPCHCQNHSNGFRTQNSQINQPMRSFQSCGCGISETDMNNNSCCIQDNIREQPTRECSCRTGAKCMCNAPQSMINSQPCLSNTSSSAPKKCTSVTFRVNADEARKSVMQSMKSDGGGSLDSTPCVCKSGKGPKDKYCVEAQSPCKPCQDYYSQETIRDTVWTVKIMKDVGLMSRMEDIGVDTQTSETRIITADGLECLLPPELRYQDEEEGADTTKGDCCENCKCEGEAKDPVKNSTHTSTTKFCSKSDKSNQSCKGKKKRKCVIM